MENYQAVFKRKEIKYLLSSEERSLAHSEDLHGAGCFRPQQHFQSVLRHSGFPDGSAFPGKADVQRKAPSSQLWNAGEHLNRFSGNQKESNGNCLQVKDQPPLSGSRLLPVRAADCFH